jgi:plasmid stability protein
LSYIIAVKTTALTVRRCPEEVHQALKRKAKSNHRSLNAEMLTLLEKDAEQKPVTLAEWGDRLRKARKLMTEAEHKEFAADIEKARKLMNREHLH